MVDNVQIEGKDYRLVGFMDSSGKEVDGDSDDIKFALVQEYGEMREQGVKQNYKIIDISDCNIRRDDSYLQ